MINETTSLELKKAIKNGDFESFVLLMNNNSINANDHFYGKKESSCWPLIQFALDNAFTNKNHLGRLKIADYLVKNGADLNDLRPYGASVIYSFLCQHYYLKDTRATYDVYLLTLVFALELIRQESMEVAPNKKFDILEQAMHVYSFHLDNNNEELLKLSRQIAVELLQKGAKYLGDDDDYIEIIQELVKTVK